MNKKKRKLNSKSKRKKSKRRKSNSYPCNGECGDAECPLDFDRPATLKRHVERTLGKYTCPVSECLYHTKGFGQRATMHDHVRSQHPKHVHLLPEKRSSPLPVPPRFADRNDEFGFVKKMVLSNIQSDLAKRHKWTAAAQKLREWEAASKGTKKETKTETVKNWRKAAEKLGKWSDEDKAYLDTINTNPEKHRIAIEIMDHLVEHNMFDSPYVDAANGFIRGGLQFRAHGGLFKPSYDRNDNDRPHFLSGAHAMANLTILPLCLNDRTNPFHHHGSKLCAVLRKKAQEPVSAEQVRAAIEFESQTGRKVNGKWTDMKLNACCNGFWQKKNDECHQAFDDLNKAWRWALNHLKAIECRCELSGIFMLGATASEEDEMYQMSIDAIDPVKGHVPGNMRIVCRFLNPINHDRDKKRHDEDDGVSIWTKDLYNEWVGL